MSIKTAINYISLIIIILISFSNENAHAAKKKKKRAQEPDQPVGYEVYSATELGSPGSDALNDRGLVAPDPKVKDEDLLVKREMVSAMQPPAPPVNDPITPIKLNEFDSVPQSQIESVAARLKLVEQILRKHKRAYDYRSNTSVELQAVQIYLDKKSH
ncbi:MAG: hypothetical protein KA715_00770 [Xanthomonadaceae bacterium]|nr:hypothetical protein [Xanthomonadaceae bacterium]